METATTNGVAFLGTLGVIFIVLKLVGAITWSWFYVLLPWIVPVVFVLVVFGAMIAWMVLYYFGSR